MSRYAGMSPRARRGWAVGLIAVFAIMCAAIGVSQWWAIHKNVPYYQAKMNAHEKTP